MLQSTCFGTKIKTQVDPKDVCVCVCVRACVCVCGGGGGGYSRKKCSEKEHAYGNKGTPRVLHESRVPGPTSEKK